jgi:hypothetical protein
VGENVSNKKIIVIGGGASGLVAAIAAKYSNSMVTILERNPKIAKKILATGNGRCNYTNVLATEFNYNHPEFVKPALQVLNPEATIQFFETLGIVPKVEDNGKTYPLSEQASSFLDVFMYEINRSNINLICDTFVENITKKGNTFIIKDSNGNQYTADAVILTTGGKVLPKSGSDGSGYGFAQSLGHTITHVFPSLTKLKLDYPYLKQLDGVKIPGKAELIYQNQSLQTETGDVLFTSYGISGPTILQLSRKAIDLHLNHQEVFIKVTLVNELSKADVKRRIYQFSDKSIEMCLVGLINKKFIPVLLKEVGIHDSSTEISQISPKSIHKLVELLFDWRFKVIGYKGYEDAQVTAGGITIDEVNPMTMESKLIKGLYFAGEILDIDALCGGYNLQWAWSSGYLAGISASLGD